MGIVDKILRVLFGGTALVFITESLKVAAIAILKALGIGFLVYQGADLLVETFGGFLLSKLTDVITYAPQITGIIGLLNIDKFLGLILSAYTARLSFMASYRTSFKPTLGA